MSSVDDECSFVAGQRQLLARCSDNFFDDDDDDDDDDYGRYKEGNDDEKENTHSPHVSTTKGFKASPTEHWNNALSDSDALMECSATLGLTKVTPRRIIRRSCNSESNELRAMGMNKCISLIDIDDHHVLKQSQYASLRPRVPTDTRTTRERSSCADKSLPQIHESLEVVDLCASDDEYGDDIGEGLRSPIQAPSFNRVARDFLGQLHLKDSLSPTATGLSAHQLPIIDEIQDFVLEEVGSPKKSMAKISHTSNLDPQITQLRSSLWNPSQTLPPHSKTHKSNSSRKRQRLRQASNPRMVGGLAAFEASQSSDFKQVSSELWFRPKVVTAQPTSAPLRNDVSGGSGVGAGNFILKRQQESFLGPNETPLVKTKKTKKKGALKSLPKSMTNLSTVDEKSVKETRKAAPKKAARGKKWGGWRRKSKGRAGTNSSEKARDPWCTGYQHRTTAPRSDAELQHVGGATISF